MLLYTFDQVSLLDSQLKEKSSVMEEYVGELSQLRSEMAGIKKNQEREISELKEEYSRQIEEVRLGCCYQWLLKWLSIDEDYTHHAMSTVGIASDAV